MHLKTIRKAATPMNNRQTIQKARRFPNRQSMPMPASDTMRRALPPWIVHYGAEQSRIEFYDVVAGKLVTVAETPRGMEGIDHKANADFIVRVVNDHEKCRKLIADLAAALQLCLTCELSWEAEQEAEIMCKRAEKYIDLQIGKVT